MYNYKLLMQVIFAFFIFAISQSGLVAQVLQRDTTSKPKREVEIIQFGDNAGGGRSKQGQPSSKYIVKVAPLAFVAGYFPVFLEREYLDWLSLQAGVGITFKSVINELLSDFGSSIYEDSGSYIDYSYRKATPGILLSFAPRLYFESDGFEGGYLSPEIRFNTQNTKAQKPNPSSIDLMRLNGEYDPESYKHLDLMIHYGQQTLYPKLTLDWSFGLGIRSVNSKVQTVFQNNGNTWTSSFEESSYNSFRVQLGLRLGFQL